MRTRREAPAVVGLDLSLTGPAAVYIPGDWEVGRWSSLSVRAWQPPAPESAEDWRGSYARLKWIADQVTWFVGSCGPRVKSVAVESYAFNARSSSVTKLAELGGAVRVALYANGVVAVPLAAAEARKLLLGKVPRKDQKYAAQAALWAAGAPVEWSGDVLDALAIANLARSNAGEVALTLAQ